MDKIVGIYKITNKINEKVYIGESEDISRRWVEHLTDLVSNEHCNHELQDDFNKYGIKNFKFETIETILVDDENKDYSVFKTKMSLLCREFFYINKYHAINSGYNIVSSLKDIVVNHKDIYYRDRPADKVMQIMIHRFLKDHINLIKEENVIDDDCIMKTHIKRKSKKSIKKNNVANEYKNVGEVYKECKRLKLISNDMPVIDFRTTLAKHNLLKFENYSWHSTDDALNDNLIILGKEKKNGYGFPYNQVLFTDKGVETVKNIFNT